MKKQKWLGQFCEAAAFGIKVAVVDKEARMLAAANLEGHLITRIPLILGDKWHEFVDPRDMPAVRRWFAEDEPGEPIAYRQLCQIDGKPTMCRIALVKSWTGDAWLCVGAVKPLSARRRQPSLEGEA